MNLVIDVGNTLIKAALFEKGSLVRSLHGSCDVVLRELSKLNAQYVEDCLFSSVTEDDGRLLSCLEALPCRVLRLNETTPLPFTNLYRTPQTLGSDRVAAMAGALTLWPNRNVLVIDIGTCITYDLIDEHKKYFGGSISPGPTMRFLSLNEHTAKLPLVEKEGDCPFVGYDTETAIRSGVVNGILYEMQGVAQQTIARYPDLIVVLTGGQSRRFEHFSLPDNEVRREPNLVEYGLNAILENLKKNEDNEQ